MTLAGVGFLPIKPTIFKTLRALNDIAAYEADTSEILEAIKHIHAGDAQGWFRAWSQAGDWVAARARATADHIARDRALLRAHNYYRTAEFFLPPNDPNRPASAEKNIWCFYAGLDTLGVAYERIRAPYGTAHHLEAVYYPLSVRIPTRQSSFSAAASSIRSRAFLICSNSN